MSKRWALALCAAALLGLVLHLLTRTKPIARPSAPAASEDGRQPSEVQARPLVRPASGADADSAEAGPAAVNLGSEAALKRAAYDVLDRDPEQTLELIETADRRYGDADEERRVLEIEALVRLQRIGLSHARAASFYRRFPGSAYARDIEQLTGYHPRPPGHE